MKKKFLITGLVIAVVTFGIISGCKKTETSEPLEPISLVLPDTSIIRQFPGDVMPIEIKFTTDRPINWVKGLYDIDTTNSTTHIASYPDTLFFLKLDTLNPRVNLYTYSGSYTVVDTLDPFDVVRFRVSFEAGSTTFTTGQNYPAGKVGATKEFKILVR